MLNPTAIHSIYETIFKFHNDKIGYDIVMEILKDHFCNNDEDAQLFDDAVIKALSSFNNFKTEGLVDEIKPTRIVCRNTRQGDFDIPLSLSDMAGNDYNY